MSGKRTAITTARGKQWAAWYLRELAQQPVNALVASDLAYIADCILHGWPKGTRSIEREIWLARAVHLVDNRPPGMSVEKALDNMARELAPRFGATTEAARALLKERIRRARKRRK